MQKEECKRRRALLAIVAAAFIGGGMSRAVQGQEALTLVREGKPCSSIVLAKAPTKAAQMAAFELQHHLKTITGATVPIVREGGKAEGLSILVGESDATRALGLKSSDFMPQEYLIRSLPKALVLMGRDKEARDTVQYDYVANPHVQSTWPSLFDEQGTLYATYDFLEKHCGVRWINPTDVGTVYVPSDTLTVRATEVRRRPFMLWRGGNAAEDVMAERYQYGGGLWRRNTKEAREYMNSAYASLREKWPADNSFNIAVRARNKLFQLRMKAGGDYRMCNHSFYHYYERFWEKEPTRPDHFIERRPELFAKGYEGTPPQLCYTDPATLEQVVADARDYFDHGGHQTVMSMIGAPGYTHGENYFAVVPMDNGAFCRCERCAAEFAAEWSSEEERRGQYSEHWFKFVNQVARELKKTHPDKFVSTLAYGGWETPPSFPVEDNVAMHFCLSANRLPGTDPKGLAGQFARLERWHKDQPRVPRHLWLFHTFPREIADNGLFYCFPGFFAHELDRQFDRFVELDIQGVFHCGFIGEIENYVTYKLMDDPTQDVDALLDDYFRAYGDADDEMRAWYELAESRYVDPNVIPAEDRPANGHQNVKIAWEHLGDAKTMAKLGALMDQARAQAAGPAAGRLKLWEQSVWSYMLEGRKSYVERMAAPIPSLTAPRVPAAHGDPSKVEWKQAVSLGDKWYQRGDDVPSTQTFGGRLAHDGEFFYLELVEENVTADQLQASPVVHPYDCWEPVFALQRAQPFRQYSSGPTGMSSALSHGEVNWRQSVPMTETGFRVTSDTSGNRWVTRMSWPLATILDRPLKAGESMYMNVIRVTNPKLSKQGGILGIDTWVSHCTVKEVDRLAEVKLAP